MNAQQILINFQQHRIEIFKDQDSENGGFDVVFEINGNKLYAHKFMLCPVSPTFNSMLSDRWTKPNESVKIEGYTFDDFKEFLTFLYSGECQLTNDNILAMIDIAEFYGIEALKNICEKYLSEMLNLENVHEMVEIACKYSLKEFKKNSLDEFFTKNFSTFFKSDKFQSLQKITVKELIKENQETWNQEELFEGIYKWAENQALENQKLDQCLKINEIIRDELSEILPYIKFQRMNTVFFHEFVVEKSFLFSGDKWSDILLARKTTMCVKVTDGNGNSMKGEIQCDDNEAVANVIKKVKGQCCSAPNLNYFDWPTKAINHPSTPSKLIQNDKTEWCLVYTLLCELAVVRRNCLLNTDYLLTEMSEEYGFEMSDKCQIEILY